MTNKNNGETHKVRVHKWLAELGMASRREAERWIEDGLVYINGKQAKIGDALDPNIDKIMVKNKAVPKSPPGKVYFLLNKPDYTLVSRSNEMDRMTIYDLPALKRLKAEINPVGRLDYRTTGLLLLTNDGQLAYRLTKRAFHVKRSYLALVNGSLSKEHLEAIKAGLTLEDGKVGKVKIKLVQGQSLGKTKGTWYDITVNEGRNRLVRRIFEHFDLKVVKLSRYAFHDIFLPDDLSPGKVKALQPSEVKALRLTVGLIDV